MKKLSLLVPLLTALSLPLAAHAVDLEDVTMDVVKEQRNKGAARSEVRSIVANYLLENGLVTQAELDEQKAQRAQVREEVRALREAGDQEALQARLAELREERAQRREQFQELIQNNDELRAAVEAQRQQSREQRQARREERQARRAADEERQRPNRERRNAE